MPWLLSCEGGGSWTPSRRQCERTAFSFYVAVRERRPAWLLEDARRLEAQVWDGGRPRGFLPAEALLYAVVHDHREYARFLLSAFTDSALSAPPCGRCSAACAAPLCAAVRYDRLEILGAMAAALRGAAGGGAAGGGAAASGGAAARLAVQLSRPDALLPLLLGGARPDAVDAVDAALQRLRGCGAAERRLALRCLHLLLLFLPAPQAQARWLLRDEPRLWQSMLGDAVFCWLAGVAPPPLTQAALRCLVRFHPQRVAALPAALLPHGWL